MQNPQRKTKQRNIVMNVNSFDPLDFIEQYKLGSQNESEKIKKRKQVEGEAIAKAIKNAQDDTFGKFATKDDLDKLELILRSDIDKIETKLEAKIDKVELSLKKDMQIMEKNLTIKMSAIVVGALGFFQVLGRVFV